ncbi:MAG: ABC transporter ATP-binding protein, partial [Chloroflexota bacterium]
LHEIVDGGRTVILITHDMRLVAEHCARSVLLHRGRLRWDGDTVTLFHDTDLLESVGISPPQIARLARHFEDVDRDFEKVITVDQMVRALRGKLGNE